MINVFLLSLRYPGAQDQSWHRDSLAQVGKRRDRGRTEERGRGRETETASEGGGREIQGRINVPPNQV